MPGKIVTYGHKFLANKFCYDSFQSIVGSYSFKNEFLRDCFSSFEGSAVLDLGCGTGIAANFASADVEYYGIDVSAQYIDKVLDRKSDAKVFIGSVSDIKPYDSVRLAHTDLALALGLFHHIDDYEMMKCLENLRSSMSTGSVLKSFDPVIDNSTTKVAAWVARNDRGQNLRSVDELCSIFEQFSFKVRSRIERNVIRIPVDLVVCEVTAI
jgi:SAM-dependent methyltransferase